MPPIGSWGSAPLSKWRFLFDARFGGVPWDVLPPARPAGSRISRGKRAEFCLLFGEG